MKLYRYYQDQGRMGAIEGVFFLEDEQLARYKKHSNLLHWSELLGKHSEGEYTFDDTTLTVVDIPDSAAKILYDALGDVISGPFDFEYFDEIIAESDELDEEEEDE
jgi:hypothetical protein